MLRIGITRGRNHHRYEQWFVNLPGVEVITLSYDNRAETIGCNGVLFSGGQDIHPSLYGKQEYVREFSLTDIDEARDESEIRIAEKVFANRIPVLGICRGLQLINAWLGGTLMPDLQSAGKQDHRRTESGDRIHRIRIKPGSELARIVGCTEGEVNSSHHQAVDQPAPGWEATAWSEDGVVEALGCTAASNHHVVLVQWHPERIPDQQNPMAASLLRDFLNASSQHQP